MSDCDWSPDVAQSPGLPNSSAERAAFPEPPSSSAAHEIDFQESRGRRSRNNHKQHRLNDPSIQERRRWWKSGWVDEKEWQNGWWEESSDGQWHWCTKPAPPKQVEEGSQRWRAIKETELRLRAQEARLLNQMASLESYQGALQHAQAEMYYSTERATSVTHNAYRAAYDLQYHMQQKLDAATTQVRINGPIPRTGQMYYLYMFWKVACLGFPLCHSILFAG